MEDVLVIHTGGTIAMTDDVTLGTIVTKEHPLKQYRDDLNQLATIEEDYLFDLPSPHMTPKEMLLLGQHIESRLKERAFSGIVVTHGTDTLEETAYFLDLYLQTSTPVVITGAMRSSNEVGADGLYNLIGAVRVASAKESINKGVLVVMNDEIHSSAYCIKTSSSSVATFQSPQFGPIGIITKQEVYFYHKWIEREKIAFQTVGTYVPLIKAFAGMDARFIASLTAQSMDGLVIEGFGQGNLPPATIEPLLALIEQNIPVVIVSRSFKGVVQPTYGYPGGGRDLKDKGFIFAKRLSGPKARIKLMALLEAGYKYQRIEEILER